MENIEITNDALFLSDLSPGACAEVLSVRNPEELARLQAMGVCRGRRVEVVKAGDPLIIRVFGSRIGLSARLAADVEIRLCARAPRCWEEPS